MTRVPPHPAPRSAHTTRRAPSAHAFVDRDPRGRGPLSPERALRHCPLVPGNACGMTVGVDGRHLGDVSRASPVTCVPPWPTLAVWGLVDLCPRGPQTGPKAAPSHLTWYARVSLGFSGDTRLTGLNGTSGQPAWGSAALSPQSLLPALILCVHAFYSLSP